MPLSKIWFSFSGRISRRTWWLVVVVPWLVLLFVAAFLDGLFGLYDAAAGTGIIQTVVTLALLWPILSGHAKRCHDRGRSAWFILINLIPIVGGIWFLVELGFLRGTVGDNRFGTDPAIRTALDRGPPAGARSGPAAPMGSPTPEPTARTTIPTQRAKTGGISRDEYVAARAPGDEA